MATPTIMYTTSTTNTSVRILICRISRQPSRHIWRSVHTLFRLCLSTPHWYSSWWQQESGTLSCRMFLQSVNPVSKFFAGDEEAINAHYEGVKPQGQHAPGGGEKVPR